MSWRDLTAYLVLSRNGEDSFNELLSVDPDPGHLRRGPSHGIIVLV